jgi:outer membrane protein assembly factor BamD
MTRSPTTAARSLSLRLLPFIALAAVSIVVGCSSLKKQDPAQAAQGKAVSGTDEQIFIGDTIEKNYDPNVIIKRAEAFFDKEDYPEAIIEYQHFLDLHHVHTLAPYAQFKLGESHFKLAKTVDRDLEPVRKAQEAFEKLLKEFPGSRYEREAVERIRGCQEHLAKYSFFVGEFYYRRESYLAAAYRFEGILKKYPDMEVAPDAMYYLALSYKELGADDWAREQLTLLAEKYPVNKYARDGEKLLAKLNGNSKQPARPVIARAERTANELPVAPVPAVVAADLQPAGQPPLTPTPALVPAAVVPASVLGSAASNGNGLAQPVTLCRLGSWC